MTSGERSILLTILALLVTASIFVASGLGAVKITIAEILNILLTKLGISNGQSQHEAVFWVIRLPRVLLSAFVGAGLAISGTAMQGIFRNPLADPSIIGISSGAASTASVFIVVLSAILPQWYTMWGVSLLSIASFIGAAITAWLIFTISHTKRGADLATMLLAGIAINALGGAITGVMTFLADDVQLRSLTFWTLGSLGGATWQSAGIVAAITTVCLIFLIPVSKGLNAMALGESEALHIGINVQSLKVRVIILTTLAVSATVAFCGIIGFIGLAVPHILRISFSSDNRFLLPASALGGALLLIWADTLSRTIAQPAEVPIGVITALTGAPVFLYLLIQQKRKAKYA